MHAAYNDQLIIQAARSDATGYVDLGNAAARKLDAAFVRNVPAMTEGTYRGRADALRSFIASLEARMTMGTTIEIEAAIRSVIGAVHNVEEFLAPPKAPAKPAPTGVATKVTDATPRTCTCDSRGCF